MFNSKRLSDVCMRPEYRFEEFIFMTGLTTDKF